MKTFSIRLLAVLFLGLTMISCEELIEEVDIPEEKPKLVVQSFISPQDTAILVWVSESLPVLGTSYYEEIKFINDALVVMSGGQNGSIVIPYSGIDGLYIIPSADFQITAGTTYYLSVKDASGERVATAECTVPSSRNETLVITGIDTVINYEYPELYLEFQFRDTPGQTDFYRVGGYSRMLDPYTLQMIDYPLYIYDGKELVSDRNKDGNTFYYHESIQDYYLVYVSVMLLSTDENYYRYHQSVNSYQGSDPFFEPTLIFSNVTGGLGVFAASNRFEQIYYLK